MASNPDDTVQRLLALVDGYDIAACDAALAAAVDDLEPLVLVRDVVAPVLREAGNRWHRGEWAVIQERMLSGTVKRQLHHALESYLRTATGPRVLFTTLSGERHEMGGLMGAVLAASRGYRCIYLGPDLPAKEIALFCAHQPVDAIALSVVTEPEVIDVAGQLAELRQGVPAPVEIWVAGHAVAALARKPLPAGVSALPDLPAFIERLAALRRCTGDTR